MPFCAGLSYNNVGAEQSCACLLSLPAGGAWIEMCIMKYTTTSSGSLPAGGAWIEMPWCHRTGWPHQCRSPQGERGLKSKSGSRLPVSYMSLPAGGAWIEIVNCDAGGILSWSLPAGGAWIEMIATTDDKSALSSLPAGGAWIEMPVRIRSCR